MVNLKTTTKTKITSQPHLRSIQAESLGRGGPRDCSLLSCPGESDVSQASGPLPSGNDHPSEDPTTSAHHLLEMQSCGPQARPTDSEGPSDLCKSPRGLRVAAAHSGLRAAALKESQVQVSLQRQPPGPLLAHSPGLSPE